MPISTIFTALFYPYIAHERTAQNLILSVRSERSALCLKERHRSQNEVSLKSEERLSDFKERSICPALPFGSVRYTANWRQVYFGCCTVHMRQSKLGASWQCILHRRTATARCKILHRGVTVRWCKIHRQLVSSLFWELHSTYKAK